MEQRERERRDRDGSKKALDMCPVKRLPAYYDHQMHHSFPLTRDMRLSLPSCVFFSFSGAEKESRVPCVSYARPP